ncbi:MAG: NmrA/HSCARG family protein [Chitinophagaceae bacterium]|nr:NmrA/HSCARG family protein [Chitinophagaceae bacterium]
MHNRNLVLVTGATGAQGGSVARKLLADGRFGVRIFTRNGNSPKAVALQEAGAEVATGDFNDVKSLRKAMEGVYGVFGVTDFDEHYEREIFQGKNLIDAVKQSGVEHFVYSSSPNYHKLSNGEHAVPQCDIKARLQEYAKSHRVPASFVHVAFYYENFINLFPLQRDRHGNLHFGFPQGKTKLAMTGVKGVGGVVAKIFEYPVQYIGRTVGVVGEDRPCEEYAQVMSKVLEQNVYYHHIPRDIFIGFDSQAEKWADVFEVQRLHISNRHIDLIESYGLNPEMQSFESWLRENRQIILSLIPAREEGVLV